MLKKLVLLAFFFFLSNLSGQTLFANDQANTFPTKESTSSYLDVSIQKQATEGEIFQGYSSLTTTSENNFRFQRRILHFDTSSSFFSKILSNNYIGRKSLAKVSRFLSADKKRFHSLAAHYYIFELRKIII